MRDVLIAVIQLLSGFALGLVMTMPVALVVGMVYSMFGRNAATMTVCLGFVALSPELMKIVRALVAGKGDTESRRDGRKYCGHVLG